MTEDELNELADAVDKLKPHADAIRVAMAEAVSKLRAKGNHAAADFGSSFLNELEVFESLPLDLQLTEALHYFERRAEQDPENPPRAT